jgi:hypothetical protein
LKSEKKIAKREISSKVRSRHVRLEVGSLSFSVSKKEDGVFSIFLE